MITVLRLSSTNQVLTNSGRCERIKLKKTNKKNYPSSIHDQYFITGKHSVESVRNNEHRTVAERLLNRLLYFLITLAVDGRSGLVHHDDLAVAQNRARHADQLALADAEVITVFLHLRFQFFRERS